MRVPLTADRPALFSPRLIPVFVVLGLVALCPSCSSGRRPVYPVRGQVLVKGKPAFHAQVTFHPVVDNSPEAVHPVGIVDEEGSFTLTSYKQGDGAPEGEYLVTVQWFLATKPRNASADDDYITVNHLPPRYGSTETSGLRATVRKGDNELPPFSPEPR
jgi:hypothetical protein